MSNTNVKENLTHTLGPNGIIVKNWSSIDGTLHKLNYIWKIHNYRFYHKKQKVLKSSTFSAATDRKCKWYLDLRPGGVSNCEDYVAIYLGLDSSSECEDVFVEYKISIMDSQQKKVFLTRTAEILEYTLLNKESWGTSEFIKKSELLDDKLLPNGTLTIYCEVTYSEAEVLINTSEQSNCTPPQPDVSEYSFSKDFRQLFDSQAFTDVVLSVNGNDYRAHKLILVTRSPVFAAMFQHNMKESEKNRVDIIDIEEEVMKDVLNYIYKGKPENLKKLADGLLMAADKYDLKGLKIMCEEELLRNLSIESAANTLYWADLHHANELKSKTINFIVANSAKVMNTAAWKSVISSNLQLINEVCEALSHQLAVYFG